MKSKYPEIIYGGAFSPPTIAHKAVIDGVLQRITQKVLIVPSGDRSDKQYAYDTPTRKWFFQAFSREFEGLQVEVDTTFIDNHLPTTTLGIDDFYKQKYGYSLPQVFGADVVNSMRWWDPTPSWQERLLRVLPKILIARKWVEMVLDGLENYVILDVDVPEASSTAVREQWRIDLLTPRVRKLYESILTK
jgi:nicotinic acid mononucleotide adenylyltransferase